MTDRDKIPNSIRYRQTYKEICERQDSETVAQAAVRRMAKHIRRNGKGGLALLKQGSNQLKPLAQDSLLRHMIDWDEEHDQIDTRIDYIEGDPDLIDSARRACHDLLDSLQDGQDVGSITQELQSLMFMKEWQALKESIPEHAIHHMDAQYEEIIQRMEALELIVMREVKKHLSGEKLPEVDPFAGDLTRGLIV